MSEKKLINLVDFGVWWEKINDLGMCKRRKIRVIVLEDVSCRNNQMFMPDDS